MLTRGSELAYIAGPSCSPEERRSLLGMKEALERSGYETYLPFRDGVEGLLLTLEAGVGLPGGILSRLSMLRRASFALETYQIVDRCDCLVFNMNGRVPDGGGVFKAALAFSTGKPLVIYKRDHRSVFSGRDNSMVTGLTRAFSTVDDFADIHPELRRAVGKASSLATRSHEGGVLPGNVRTVIALGSEIWDTVCREDLENASTEEIEGLTEEVVTIFASSEPGRSLGWSGIGS